MSTLAIKGRISELEKQKNYLAIQMKALLTAIRDRCDAARSDQLEDVAADAIASLADSLAQQRREYRETLDMIKELEREI